MKQLIILTLLVFSLNGCILKYAYDAMNDKSEKSTEKSVN
jgi:hypothetical protein